LTALLTAEQINPLIPLIGTIITAIIGVVSAKLIVSKWQTRKDISEIRKEVIRNYTISFKDHVNLMDTFIAELIMSYAKFVDSHKTDGQRLSELLPWGYTYKDLIEYSKKKDLANLQDWRGKNITTEKLRKRFETIKESTEFYIDFQNLPPLNKFKLKYRELQNKFYKGRPAIMEFSSLVNQYYVKPGMLLSNFSAMWEYMMACFVLINKIMYTENIPCLVKNIKIYNDCSYYLFYFLSWFEEELISKKIEIDKNGWTHRLDAWLNCSDSVD